MSQKRSFLMFADWRIGLYRLFAVLAACMVLAACATEPVLTDHAFSFDSRRESPDVEVVKYRYGTSKVHGTHPEAYSVSAEDVQQMTNTNGPMLRGDFLYVKWRIKRTGKEYEDTVDLRSRLPADITDHRIHFVIKGPQLYVYLISPDQGLGRCPADTGKAAQATEPGDRIFRMYCDLKIDTIYPNQPTSK